MAESTSGRARVARAAVGTLAATMLFAVGDVTAALALQLEAERLRMFGVRVERVRLEGAAEPSLQLIGVSHPAIGTVGDFLVRCDAPRSACASGQLGWSGAELEALEIEFQRDRNGLVARAGEFRAEFRASGGRAYRVDIAALPIDWLRRLPAAAARVSQLGGLLDAEIQASSGAWSARLGLRNAGFDTPDGWAAAASLNTELRLSGAETGKVDVEGVWSGGELLVGAVYLPPPEPALRARMTLARLGESWGIERFDLDAGASFEAAGSLRSGPGPVPVEITIDSLDADLGWIWRQGLRSIAATYGWGGLEPAGRLSASLEYGGDRLRRLALALSETSIADRDERIALAGLDFTAGWRAASRQLELELGWDEASVYRVPMGSSRVALYTTPDGGLEIREPWRIPVLDGALVVDELAWRGPVGADGSLALDARLEPVDLEALVTRFGWPAMGGSIAGRFPGIRIGAGAARFDGGMRIDLFDGTARIERLSIERPFGSDPALGADVFLDRLDLDLLTRAFEFGTIRGLLSGSIEDLRLLDWQPVAFDAWFETLESSPEREISQRAVDSLSTLSGGGGAAVSGILMRWFDSFPYRRIGLGCRLAANVCRMRGLRSTDTGGYVILEGRAIPRLDIVGYQQRVDWPQLIEQLQAASGGTAGRPSDGGS